MIPVRGAGTSFLRAGTSFLPASTSLLRASTTSPLALHQGTVDEQDLSQ